MGCSTRLSHLAASQRVPDPTELAAEKLASLTGLRASAYVAVLVSEDSAAAGSLLHPRLRRAAPPGPAVHAIDGDGSHPGQPGLGIEVIRYRHEESITPMLAVPNRPR